MKRACLGSALAALCLSPLCGAASPDANDVPDAPVAVDISFIPDGLSFGTHIDNAILQKIGCRYAVHDPAIASKLLMLAVTARDRPQDAVDPKQRFEIRNKMVFHFQKKDDISVEFSQKYSNQAYLEASWNAEPVHLNTDLIEKVRETVRSAGGTQTTEHACVTH